MKQRRLTAAAIAIMMITSLFLMAACASQSIENTILEKEDTTTLPVATETTGNAENIKDSESPFVFEKIDGGYELKKYNGAEAAPNIPEEYMNEPVIAVGDGAFANNNTLTNIWFSPSITSVGDGAFENCTNLNVAMIPDTVFYIGKNAFAGCEKLSIQCEAAATSGMYWDALWNPDKTPVTWESTQGLEFITFDLIKDAGLTLLKSCGSSLGKVAANTIMSELGFGKELDPRYTEELEKVRNELTKLNEQTAQIDKKLDAMERKMLSDAERRELNSRMTTINEHISKINTLYDEYLDLANASDPALQKSYTTKLAEKIEKADIPAKIDYIHRELTEKNAGIQQPILTLYNEFLEGIYPFKHESAELTQMFYEHISGIEAKGVILHTAFCNYQQKNDAENAQYYQDRNVKLIDKAKKYFEKQISMIPKENDYKMIVDMLSVYGGGEYPIFRLKTNGTPSKTLYLMDHALPATGVVVAEKTVPIYVQDPNDDMYMMQAEKDILSVATPYTNHLARTTIAELDNFFAVKDACGSSNMSNLDFLAHHLPLANLSNIICNSAGPFVLVNDEPSSDEYIPGVLLNSLNKGLVKYQDGMDNIGVDKSRCRCDTLILWTDSKNQPDLDILEIYYERTNR